MPLREKMRYNPRRPVPTHILADAFCKVMANMPYTREEREHLFHAAKIDNAKAYACYMSIINSWSYGENK